MEAAPSGRLNQASYTSLRTKVLMLPHRTGQEEMRPDREFVTNSPDDPGPVPDPRHPLQTQIVSIICNFYHQDHSR